MPRPPTTRRVAQDLQGRLFKPRGVPVADLSQVALTLDGLEALRLADLEQLYHAEAASRMGVSRATFERVLSEARRAVADALVNGKAIEIAGGPVDRRPAGRWPCPVHGGPRRRGRGCGCGPGGRGEGSGRFRGGRSRSDSGSSSGPPPGSKPGSSQEGD